MLGSGILPDSLRKCSSRLVSLGQNLAAVRFSAEAEASDDVSILL
jgi:hypothetical protein